jgi:nucleoside 2-deoxyribosyltransferase
LKIYLIGSLRNPRVPEVANKIREAGHEVFDDWFSAGYEADDKWREYETARGHSYIEALSLYPAEHVFSFDKRHLDDSDAVVLLLPAGKSAHLELGYSIGQDKPAYIILDNPDRWDVMYKFATEVFADEDSFLSEALELAPSPSRNHS